MTLHRAEALVLRRATMLRVADAIHIDASVDQVFDLVATARYWLVWDPGTIRVSGVIDRPLLLGDVVHEVVRVGGRLREENWTVIGCERPWRLVLANQHDVVVGYTFCAEGQGTVLARTLDYRPSDLVHITTDSTELAWFLHDESDQTVHQLKHLVETLQSPRTSAFSQ
jgi:Polyketide cyclase / dehydrase and lipid transport